MCDGSAPSVESVSPPDAPSATNSAATVSAHTLKQISGVHSRTHLDLQNVQVQSPVRFEEEVENVGHDCGIVVHE